MKIDLKNYETSRISRRYSGKTKSGSKFTVYAEWMENEGWDVCEHEIFWDDKKDDTPENRDWILVTLLKHLDNEDIFNS